MKSINFVSHNLINELLKHWRKKDSSGIENKLQEIKSILKNWSQILLFAVRIKMDKDYTEKENKGYFSGLCKYLSIEIKEFMPHLKVTLVNTIEITKDSIWLNIESPRLIPLAKVEYIDIKRLPSSIKSLKPIFINTLETRKHIELKPPLAKKKRQFFRLSSSSSY